MYYVLGPVRELKHRFGRSRATRSACLSMRVVVTFDDGSFRGTNEYIIIHLMYAFKEQTRKAAGVF